MLMICGRRTDTRCFVQMRSEIVCDPLTAILAVVTTGRVGHTQRGGASDYDEIRQGFFRILEKKI